MERLLLFVLIWGASYLVQPATTVAQDASLETRALREDYRRLQSQLADLLEAHNALKSELSKLRTELRQFRAQTSTKDPTAVNRSDLEGLAKSIREVDRKRVQDKDLILTEMQAFLRTGTTVHKPPAVAPRSEKGFDHIVEEGQTISAIIAAYNAKLKEQGTKKRITLKSVLDSNPNLNPRTMRIGQSLFIPDPR